MSLSVELTRMFRHSLNSRVTVRSVGTTGHNPESTVAETQVPVMLVPANARDAVSLAETYAHIPTHSALVEANEHVRDGCWLVETHYRDEVGAWQAITSSEQRRFLVLGVELVPGVPEPRNQWRCWLWESTSRPLGGD
jgi:hypothetical protein